MVNLFYFDSWGHQVVDEVDVVDYAILQSTPGENFVVDVGAFFWGEVGKRDAVWIDYGEDPVGVGDAYEGRDSFLHYLDVSDRIALLVQILAHLVELRLELLCYKSKQFRVP